MFINSKPFRFIAATALVISLAAGCSNSHELETASVVGEVTINGKPVEKGVVVFTPEAGRTGTGLIEPDGTFRLTTYRDGDGAIVGKHRVAVIVSDDSKSSGVEGGVVSLVPPRYASAATSGLEYDVKAGQTNNAHLELKSP
jgi:hypothetical protein